MQKILSKVRRAIDDYNMIQEGDSIAVGVSGGKDSLTLLITLARLREFYPKKFNLCAISVSMGFKDTDYSYVKKLCDELGVPLYIKDTDIAEILFNIRKEKNPCSLCAKMRRGALSEYAAELKYNKIALGHHNEDALETFFLSLFYEGRINCFSPVTYQSRTDTIVIRPLIYTPEKEIISYARRSELPVMHNPCPANGATKREEMKIFIKEKEKTDRHFKSKMMNAIQTGLEEWKI